MHTPGPWHGNGTSPPDHDTYAVWSETGSFICSLRFPFGGTEGRVNDDEREANARLIAAAPDLLAICQEIANDSRIDLIDSERRIRLYSAIHNATP
jgi:hypothetical protein